MIKVSSETDKVCVAKVREAGQGHVFDSWDRATNEQQRALISQLTEIDFQLLKRLVQQHIHGADESHEERVLRPPPLTRLPQEADAHEERQLCHTLGDYALRNGEVALVTAAGASDATPDSEPTGMLPVGPVTGKSLFQLHAENIRAINRRYKTSLRWYIFCHAYHLDLVVAHFRENGYFGLNCSDLYFIPERLLPVVDRRGRLLLAEPDRIGMSTVGQGGILDTLLSDEHLGAMEKAGVRHVFFFQADNPLARIASPVFVGLHIKSQSDVTSKAIRRTDSDDDQAVFCKFSNTIAVVRPAEMTEEERCSRDESGELAFGAAQIGIHILTVDFLRRLRDADTSPPFHAVPHATTRIDRRGRLVRPSEPNSIRFQSFLFDALQTARSITIVEVDARDEYSPVRNASGDRSPLTAQRDLSHLYARWLKEACGSTGDGSNGELEPAVEISPLFAMDVEELKEKIDQPLAPCGGEILLGGRS